MTPTAPSSFLSDAAYTSMNGSFYPRGHVFAMLPDAASAQAAANALNAIGAELVRVATPEDITNAFCQRSGEIREAPPSVGREEQFTVRFVELARRGQYGVLAKSGDASDEAVSRVLAEQGASAGYSYGLLVIEELVDPSAKAVKVAPEPM